MKPQLCAVRVDGAGDVTPTHFAWKSLKQVPVMSSPVLVGDRIYATNEAGKTWIFKASPERLEIEAENQLGDEVFATPAICGGRIYQRVASTKDKKRQEGLYCLGQEAR